MSKDIYSLTRYKVRGVVSEGVMGEGVMGEGVFTPSNPSRIGW